jgi:hypothetical protein
MDAHQAPRQPHVDPRERPHPARRHVEQTDQAATQVCGSIELHERLHERLRHAAERRIEEAGQQQRECDRERVDAQRREAREHEAVRPSATSSNIGTSNA